MYSFINIIIPSVKIDQLLINCIYHLLKQTHNNFMITIIVDSDNNKEKLLSLNNMKNIKIDIIKVHNSNISTKRNIGAFKSRSDYLAFIDSDAYPVKEWLTNALKIFKNKNIEVVTGPTGLPFPNETYFKKLINISKRSFFCSGKWAKRKYSTEDFFVDNIESCNFIIKASTYKKINGMNEKIYIGEDSEFANKINKRFGNNKIFHSGKCAIFHKDRNLKNLIIQRFAWGMYMNIEFKNVSGLNKIFFLMPLIGSFLGMILVVLSYWYTNLIILLLTIFTIFCFLVFMDLSKFKINIFQKSICILIILISNISYSIGNLICFTRMNKFIGKIIYRKSRANNINIIE